LAIDTRPETPVRNWISEMARAASPEEARQLWADARDAGLSQDGLDGLAALAKEVLARLAAPAAPETDWQALFAAVQDRNGALALWRRAESAGVAGEALALLGAIAKAVLVTDKDGARDAYTDLAAHTRAGRLGRDRLDKLLGLMKTRVPVS